MLEDFSLVYSSSVVYSWASDNLQVSVFNVAVTSLKTSDDGDEDDSGRSCCCCRLLRTVNTTRIIITILVVRCSSLTLLRLLQLVFRSSSSSSQPKPWHRNYIYLAYCTRKFVPQCQTR